MPKPLLFMEAADIRRSDTPDSSRALTITNVTLPELSRKRQGYTPGGGNMEMNVTLPFVDPIVPKFKLSGYDSDYMASFGIVDGNEDRFVIAGSIQDKKGKVSVPLRAKIQGYIALITPDEFTPGSLPGTSYEIHEVSHYELILNNIEVHYLDFYERVGRSGGRDWFAPVVSALGG